MPHRPRASLDVGAPPPPPRAQRHHSFQRAAWWKLTEEWDREAQQPPEGLLYLRSSWRWLGPFWTDRLFQEVRRGPAAAAFSGSESVQKWRALGSASSCCWGDRHSWAGIPGAKGAEHAHGRQDLWRGGAPQVLASCVGGRVGLPVWLWQHCGGKGPFRRDYLAPVSEQTGSSQRGMVVEASAVPHVDKVWGLLAAGVPYLLRSCLQDPHRTFTHGSQHCWWGPRWLSNWAEGALCDWGFPGGAVKNLPANAGDTRDVGLLTRDVGLWSGRFPGEGNGTLLQCSGLENSMDRGAWWATVHGVARSRTRLSTHAAAYLMELSCSASLHFFFFLMKAVFENFIWFVLGMLLYSMWDSSSLTRIRTHAAHPHPPRPN